MAGKRRILALQHAPPEHLGMIAEACAIEGVEFDYIRADLDESIPVSLEGFGGLVIMGGPQSVYEEEEYPFLTAEKNLARLAVAARLPVLGICLGSQILAETLGSAVRPGPHFEIGWKPVAVSDSLSRDPVLSHLPATITPLHWHGDVYDLPPGATAVGSSALTEVQGFSHSNLFYGLLFHLETTFEQLGAMIRSFPDDLRRGGVDPDSLLLAAPAHLGASHDYGLEVFRRWMALV